MISRPIMVANVVIFPMALLLQPINNILIILELILRYYYNRRIRISTWEKPRELMTKMKRVDVSTDWREFTSPEGRKYYYNKVIRTSKWRMPDEVKLMLDLNPIWLAHEKDTISHASDFGSISVVKISSPGADGLLVSAHGAKSSLIAMSPTANLPTIVASESLSLSGKVSSPMIEIVEVKNSSEPASPAVANSEKIGIAATLGNSFAPSASETTTTQDAVVYGDGFSLENRENVKKDDAITEIRGATPSDEKTVELGPLVYERKMEAKSAFKTLLESTNIGSDCTWDQIYNNDDILEPALCLAHQQILNDDDILNASIVSCMSIDILNADDILDASIVSSALTDIE
ncbi:hypothetical protein T459_28815 [Capsicum annuum]|uniref:WW domain-containing protein n=1 Tax=Capsicum annuum TaxID=4072 RepID=A0A2G2YHU8_CAPAN|nr:hypothetical protein FXO37_19529 [Capsicum annuum]PHT69328.1 hypothetical protein T459_28815 [Capsicum annuum]